MAVTLSDVARRAGVSEATASRVLNGRRYVAAGTRLRVEEAARDLDYLPNQAARNLSRARTATVALLVHHAQYPAHGEGTFSSRVVAAVSRALRRAGHDTLYVEVDDDAVQRLDRLPEVRPGRSDSVLVLGPSFPPQAVARLAESGRRVVLIDHRVPGVDAVLTENRAPMAELTHHLTDGHGYRRLVALGGPSRWTSTAERLSGVRLAARRTGADLRVVHARETTMRDGAALAERLLDDPPDALVAVNDAMALGAMHRFRALPTRRRPAVTGFDDIAWAELADPPLTSVSVDVNEIGAAAADLVIEPTATVGPMTHPAREVRVPATVRLRRSCGCRQPGGALRRSEGG